MDMTPIEKVNTYKPIILIIGVRKGGFVESVLCVTKEIVAKELVGFNHARVFTLHEQDFDEFKKSVIK